DVIGLAGIVGLIEQAEIVLGLDAALGGGFLEPVMGGLGVARDGGALEIHEADLVEGAGIAGIAGLGEIALGQLALGLQAGAAVAEQAAQAQRRIRMAEIGGAHIPFRRLI